MSKVDIEEIFFDFLDVAKQHVPDSDHVELCMDLIRAIEDYDVDIIILKGHDDSVDEAMEELYPDMSDEYDDDEHGDY